jgi:hypothetical protein
MTVGKKTLTITANDQSKVYGEANPDLTFSYSGFVNGDTQISTQPEISTIAIVGSDVGIYPIVLMGGLDDNYEINLESGTLTIGKKTLTITADDLSKIYGEENPDLTFIYAGLVNGDTQISTEPEINTSATVDSSVGTYPITLTGAQDDNYEINLESGTLTIGKKALTITADDLSKVYGEENPDLTFSYTGLVNGDTQISIEPEISTNATAVSGFGTYPILLTGGTDLNYEISLENGTLTVGKKR